MTVNVAYERLAGEGFVTSRQGAGTFVSDSVARVAHKPAKQRSRGALQSRPIWQSVPVQAPFAHPAQYDFRTGLPDATLFPHRTWRRCVAQALLSIGSTAGVYGDPAGLGDLRAAIVRQIGFSRGVEASADDIVVTTGTQQALDIIARVLLSPGDAIAVEEPGYFLPGLLFNSMGLRVAGVPVDKEGIVVAALGLRKFRRRQGQYPRRQSPAGVLSMPRLPQRSRFTFSPNTPSADLFNVIKKCVIEYSLRR